MTKRRNNWQLLGFSIVAGPIMVFYWIYYYLKGMFVEPSIHKGIRAIGVADIGISLSIASSVFWLIAITELL
jgi:hypothetical protein